MSDNLETLSRDELVLMILQSESELKSREEEIRTLSKPLCAFCDEHPFKHPMLQKVDPERGTYRCFHCRAWLCDAHAERHFGPIEHQEKMKGLEEEIRRLRDDIGCLSRALTSRQHGGRINETLCAWVDPWRSEVRLIANCTHENCIWKAAEDALKADTEAL